jgi:hypothetical protein
MDAAESNETKHDGLSININAPCTNQIYSGDHIEVHIHAGERFNSDRAQSGEDASSEATDESSIETAGLASNVLEIIIPRALRIARSIRTSNLPAS